MRGAWIEIRLPRLPPSLRLGRSPCGERGLKFFQLFLQPKRVASLPVRGAWIEISRYILLRLMSIVVAPRVGSVD